MIPFQSGGNAVPSTRLLARMLLACCLASRLPACCEYCATATPGRLVGFLCSPSGPWGRARDVGGKADWVLEARKLVLARVVGRTPLNTKLEISTWTLTCLTQAGEGCRLIFESGSYWGAGPPPTRQGCVASAYGRSHNHNHCHNHCRNHSHSHTRPAPKP